MTVRQQKRLMRQTALVERVRAYDPDADESVLNKAYVFAMQAHGPQKRASGDPFFSHPLEVAGILTDLKLTTSKTASGLRLRASSMASPSFPSSSFFPSVPGRPKISAN